MGSLLLTPQMEINFKKGIALFVEVWPNAITNGATLRRLRGFPLVLSHFWFNSVISLGIAE